MLEILKRAKYQEHSAFMYYLEKNKENLEENKLREHSIRKIRKFGTNCCWGCSRVLASCSPSGFPMWDASYAKNFLVVG